MSGPGEKGRLCFLNASGHKSAPLTEVSIMEARCNNQYKVSWLLTKPELFSTGCARLELPCLCVVTLALRCFP